MKFASLHVPCELSCDATALRGQGCFASLCSPNYELLTLLLNTSGKKLCEHANQFSCKLGVLTIIVVQHAVFFLFKFVWCTWVGDHPHDDLAKFSYRWERDVEKFRNACCVLMACYNLLSKSGDFKKIPHNVVTLGHLFPQETRKTTHRPKI
jgi:hypothetical protein